MQLQPARRLLIFAGVLTTTRRRAEPTPEHVKLVQAPFADDPTAVGQAAPEPSKPDGTSADKQSNRPASRMVDDDLLERAREEDARHWDAHRRPIFADTLRRKLHIGAARSRLLVAMIRADPQRRSAQDEAMTRPA